MKVVIFGAGNAGRFLYDEIERNSQNIEVIGFVDNYLTEEYKDTKTFKPEAILSQQDKFSAVFIAVGAQKTLKIAIDTITKYEVRNIYMLHDIAGKNRISPFDTFGNIIPELLRKIKFSKELPTLPYFEVPITDKCNLNCKGCLFACNAIDKNEHISFEQIEKDAKRMKELFIDIPWIRILGGEPLIHPHIIKILKLYREVFKDSELDLCTNGLLLPKMSKEFFDCLVENRITIHVSGYKPTYNMLEDIKEILDKYHLNFTLLKRESFSKYFTLKREGNKENNFEKKLN